MTLYAVQKFLFELNRSESAQAQFRADPASTLSDFDLTDEET